MAERWETPLMASVFWDRAPLTFTGIVRRLKDQSIQLITMEGDAVSSEFSQSEPMAGRIEGFREAQID